MNRYKDLNINFGKAICYSGYRDGQRPGHKFPSYEEVKEDLLLLEGHWKYLRLYDSGPHAEIVLDVIKNEKLDFQVMLSAYIEAEMNNFGCPWGGGVYSEEELNANRQKNIEEINRLIKMANDYADIAFCLSVGNEATVEWTDHLVPVDRVIEYVRMVKKGARQPVTFCENYVPYHTKLAPLVAELDFISIHTYPVWEYKHIHDALEYTKENYFGVANKYPDKPVMITEAGWATNSNGRGIDPDNVNEVLQEIYYHDLTRWSEEEGIITFVFEAFDEKWKGSSDELEPEKHWGLFKSDRTPKKVMRPYFRHLVKEKVTLKK
jgi:exo-beta-1,3-glucanase (GH17 family)